MEKWTRPTFLNNDVTTEDAAAREELHATLEKAMETFMNKSKSQDIVGIELFPS